MPAGPATSTTATRGCYLRAKRTCADEACHHQMKWDPVAPTFAEPVAPSNFNRPLHYPTLGWFRLPSPSDDPEHGQSRAVEQGRRREGNGFRNHGSGHPAKYILPALQLISDLRLVCVEAHPYLVDVLA